MTDTDNKIKGNLVFNEESSKRLIEKDGFLTVPFLGEREIESLIEIYKSNVDETGKPVFFTTHKDCPLSIRLKLHHAILDICKEKIDRIISNYEIVIAMYFAKKPDERSEVGLHIDPSMTLDGYNHLGLWVPLMDIDETTGQICFLKGSHKLCKPYHSLSIASPYSGISHLVYPQLNRINVKAGQCVIFDNNTLHCTMANKSGKTRIALIIKIIDKNAPLVSAFMDKAGNTNRIDLYEHAGDYYLSEYWQEAAPPSHSKYLRSIDNPHREFGEQFFRDFVNAVNS